MKKMSVLEVFKDHILNFILVFFSFSIASMLSVVVKLPANHGLQISNLNLANGYNPEDNYLKLIFIISIGFGVFWVLKKLSSYDRYFRLVIIAFLAIAVFLFTLMPGVESNVGNIDTFHPGEQLAPAQAFENGKKLYTDLFVLHGAGDDVLIPHSALHLPATSAAGGIGSYFFVKTTLELLSAFLFLFLLSRLFKSTAIFIAIATWFTLSNFSLFYYIRDIFVWSSVLLIAHLLFNESKSSKTKLLLMFLLGFVASSTYFYAIDRGFIVTFAAIATSAISVLFVRSVTGWKLNRHLTFKRILPAVYTLMGALVAQLIGLLILGGSQYTEFLKTTFITIPKYEGYLFDYPLPNLRPETFLTWLPIFIALIGAIMLYFLIKDQIRIQKALSSATLFSVVLYTTAIVFLRGGYGRPDFGHVAYATPLLFVAVFYICTLTFVQYKDTPQSRWPIALIVLLLFFPVQTIPFERITSFASMKPGYTNTYLRLPRYTNQQWINQDTTNIAAYIQHNTKPDEPIFVFTQQPIYYYLTNRQNPSRFYIPWFADPGKLSAELLKDLTKNPPKIILYNSGTSWDKPDGYTMAERAPEVESWIRNNYRTEIRVGPATLLVK